MQPSVRGSLFVAGVVAMRRHRRSGAVSEKQLAVRLGPLALEMIDQKIDVARWYPIEPFCEMLDVEWDVAGGRDPAYMRDMGRVTAARFFETCIYQQLDYARRVRRPDDRSSLVRQARLVVGVTDSLYNFLRTDVRVQGNVLEIVYDDAAPFAESLRYTTEGFMDEINRRQGASRRWTSERVAPDRVCFRLTLPGSFPGEVEPGEAVPFASA